MLIIDATEDEDDETQPVTLTKGTDYAFENGMLTLLNSDIFFSDDDMIQVIKSDFSEACVIIMNDDGKLTLERDGEMRCDGTAVAVNTATPVTPDGTNPPVETESDKLKITINDEDATVLTRGSDYTYENDTLTILNGDLAGKTLSVSFNKTGVGEPRGYVYLLAADN